MAEQVKRSELDTLARDFRHFAEAHYRNSSALYEHLAQSIALNEEVLAIATQTPQGQPVPNLLFGAVHYLLLQSHQANELAAYYPSITASPQPPNTAFPYFRDFCLAQREEIVQLIRSRRVQTNEVRRCAYLFPAFSFVFNRTQEKPLSLVEIGASAGLNLLWDRYRYHYETGRTYGDPNAVVEITTSFRGEKRPLLGRMPAVYERIGIDLNVIDVRSEEATLWLRALIWPEHTERANLLTNAIQVARSHPVTLLAGDGIALLPGVLDRLSTETAICLFHTYTLNQIPPAARQKLVDCLTEYAQTRNIYRVACEWIGTPHPQLEVTEFHAGGKSEALLAHCDAHARWIEWLY